MRYWTKPYYGVQHLDVKRPFQITVADHRTFAELTMFNFEDHGNVWTGAKREICDDAKEARKLGEKWATQRGI